MNSVPEIHEANRQFSLKAAREDKIPFLVEREDIEDWKERGGFYGDGVPFPVLGTHLPEGWMLVGWEYLHPGELNKESTVSLINGLEEGYGYGIIYISPTLQSGKVCEEGLRPTT